MELQIVGIVIMIVVTALTLGIIIYDKHLSKKIKEHEEKYADDESRYDKKSN